VSLEDPAAPAAARQRGDTRALAAGRRILHREPAAVELEQAPKLGRDLGEFGGSFRARLRFFSVEPSKSSNPPKSSLAVASLEVAGAPVAYVQATIALAPP
jgi:hypothetical protein